MKDFFLMDGGHDTQLKKYVGSGFEDHPLWISRYLVDDPEACQKVIRDYIQAGADLVLTNTYQATVDGFHQHWGLTKEQSLLLIKSAVSICREGVKLEAEQGNKNSVAVVGVVGPYGAHLHDGSEYTGGHYTDSMSIEELVEWHRPRFEALVEGDCDYYIFATIPSLKEAEALITLLKQHPGKKAIISFSAQTEDRISHGEQVGEAAQRCWDLAPGQILAVGVNCQHPRLSTALVRAIRLANPNIPLFIKPNTTEIFNTTTKEWEVADDAKSLREYCREWLELGVDYISGCCRTTVQDIADFREEISKFVNRKTN